MTTIVEDFEDGDVSEWSNKNPNFTTTTSRVFNGSFAGFADYGDISSGEYLVAEYEFSSAITEFEIYWNETNDSFGHGFQLIDSNGGRVIGLGSGNPQWLVTDGGTGEIIFSGDGVNRWVRTTATIDTGNGTANVEFEDLQSGTVRSTTETLDTANEPSKVQFVNIDREAQLADQTNVDGSSINCAIDDIGVTVPLQPPSNVSTSVSQDDITISWDAADGASQYDVLRAQSSGSVASDYSTIATITDDGSASFSVTDTALEDGERFFYRVESVS